MWLPFYLIYTKNDVEPYAWLTDVLAKIQDQPINKIEGLLPEKWQK
jgi:transposase